MAASVDFEEEGKAVVGIDDSAAASDFRPMILVPKVVLLEFQSRSLAPRSHFQRLTWD